MVIDPTAMTDLPAAERARRWWPSVLPPLLTPVRQLTCDDGTTVKTSWRLFDGALVESVLMRYPDRVTMCVSSQAGCGMNCPFCATGQAGLTRNLSTAEIVEQVVAGARLLDSGEVAGRRRSGVERRVHGHGRAAGQLPRGLDAVRRLTEPVAGRSRAISARSVTVSTVGLVPAMQRLHGRGHPGDAGGVAARARRRAARHAGAGQHPLAGRRGARRRVGLRRRAPGAGSRSSTR